MLFHIDQRLPVIRSIRNGRCLYVKSVAEAEGGASTYGDRSTYKYKYKYERATTVLQTATVKRSSAAAGSMASCWYYILYD